MERSERAQPAEAPPLGRPRDPPRDAHWPHRHRLWVQHPLQPAKPPRFARKFRRFFLHDRALLAGWTPTRILRKMGRMSLNQDLLFDIRVLERNLRKGLLDKAAFEKHLSSLKDMEENADFVDYTAEPEEEPQEGGEAAEASSEAEADAGSEG